MGKIYSLFSTQEPCPKTHSLDSANVLLPLIKKFTAEAVRQTEALGLQLQYLQKDSYEFKQICKEYDESVMTWAERIHRLGCVAKGLWLVDFDTGNGFLCWSYPENKVSHFHSYETGFKDRVKIKGIASEDLLL